jgi:flagellar assembly protein FliH
MSSSKIIKALQIDADTLSQFNFRPVDQVTFAELPDSGTFFMLDEPQDRKAGFVPDAPQAAISGFIPLDLIGDSEVKSEIETVLTPEEPEGILLTEDELDKRLRESYESGLQDGKSLAERGLLNVFASLRSATEGLHTLREKVIRESEDELVRLIMMVARKVILREVVQNRHILTDVVQAAIAGLSERDEIIIHLNPDDYANVIAKRDEYFRKENFSERLQFKADPAVHLGSCRVATEMGTIDASFDSQLDEIFRHLQEERSLSPGGGA